MKKTLFSVIGLVMLLCILTSCNMPWKHEHIWGDWEYDNETHWRFTACKTHARKIDPTDSSHIDEDGDLACDVCGATHTHTVGEWQANGAVHQKTAVCDIGICNIEPSQERHVDEDGDLKCDVCGFAHEHIRGAWEDVGKYHKQSVYCTFETCDIKATVEYHNESRPNGGFCLTCNAEHKHIFDCAPIDEYTHSIHAYCVWDTCDICLDDSSFKHYDGKIDNVCDACGYEMTAPENYFLRDRIDDWFLYESVDTLCEVDFISEYVGVAPDNFSAILSSQDKDTILRIFSELHSLEIFPISNEEGIIEGGQKITVRFCFEGGGLTFVSFMSNGVFRDEYGNYFRVANIPSLNDEDTVTSYVGFSTSATAGSIYIGKDLVGTIPLRYFKFKEADGTADIPEEIKYVVESEYDKMIFYTDEIFSFESESGVYYQLAPYDIIYCLP